MLSFILLSLFLDFTYAGACPPLKQIAIASNETSYLYKKCSEEEISLAVLAGENEIGPKATKDAATGNLKSEKVIGLNLFTQMNAVFSKPDIERDIWIENIILSLTEKLEKLHTLGYVHLDIHPKNILIPTENASGKNIFLIDYGISKPVEELTQLHKKLKGTPYFGFPGYQSNESIAGRPGIPSDLEALETVLRKDIIPGADYILEPFHTRPFVDERPRLRAALLLLREPVESEAAAPLPVTSDHKALSLSVKKISSPEGIILFWQTFSERFNLRSPGQKLKILFSDPELCSDTGFLAKIGMEDRHTIFVEGMKELGWNFDEHSITGISANNPTRFNDPALLKRQIDFPRLIEVFKRLPPNAAKR